MEVKSVLIGAALVLFTIFLTNLSNNPTPTTPSVLGVSSANIPTSPSSSETSSFSSSFSSKATDNQSFSQNSSIQNSLSTPVVIPTSSSSISEYVKSESVVAPVYFAPPAPQATDGYISGTCKQLNVMGLGNFLPGDPNYNSSRDRDNDGIACEF